MKKTYLSQRIALMHDMPVGDPYGGVAYGEKNAPAVALVGAGLSISAGVTALATSSILGGLMIAGGVMSGLGAITGNKTLSKLGMVAGLAGGVGNFFSNGGFDGFSEAWDAGEGFSGGMSNIADQWSGAANYGSPAPVQNLDVTGAGAVGAAPADALQAAVNPMNNRVAGTVSNSDWLKANGVDPTFSGTSGGLVNQQAPAPVTDGVMVPVKPGSNGLIDSLKGMMPTSDMGKMAALEAVKGVANAPAAKQTADAAEKTADATADYYGAKTAETTASTARVADKIDGMNSNKTVNMAATGDTAYRDASGKAITAQQHWEALFSKYFPTSTPATA